MKILYFRLYVGCIALLWASASPAFGNSDPRPGDMAEYVVTNTTSASGWATVTLIPVRVECERILRSVTMEVYALGGTSAHRHDPASVSCNEDEGHFSVRVKMDAIAAGGGSARDAPTQGRSTILVPVRDGQASHGPGDGHDDHQHTLYIIHDLE